MNLDVVRYSLTHADSIRPSRSHEGDAGYDLSSCIDLTVLAGAVVDVPTGVHVEMPPGVWGMLTGRSSTIRKRGLLVTTGIIDNGYRGELFYAVLNPGHNPVKIAKGERLAQLIFFPLVEFHRWQLTPLEDMDETSRGSQGFGSTGH